MITTSFRVVRWSNRNSFGGTQELVKEYRLFGFKVWSVVLDKEDVPAWAAIQEGALGSTDWVSKFSKYI